MNSTASNPHKPIQEFNENGGHRLISANGQYATQWADYRSLTYLDGWVGHTAYFGKRENVCTPQEFMELTGVGLAETAEKVKKELRIVRKELRKLIDED